MLTMGTLTSSESALAEEVTGPYKWYEIEPRCGGGAVGFSAFFGGLSISQLRPDPGAGGGGSAVLRVKSEAEGSNRLSGRKA